MDEIKPPQHFQVNLMPVVIPVLPCITMLNEILQQPVGPIHDLLDGLLVVDMLSDSVAILLNMTIK